MKKRAACIFLIIYIAAVLLAIPLSLVVAGFCIPPQYAATYYAELQDMYSRLCNTQGKRIIFIGNSALAFGLETDALQSELKEYTVCPFGLYGAIGTKAMMDMARNEIREDDIVVICPEQNSQSQSLYFNAEYIWNAIDGKFSILGEVAAENRSQLFGAYPSFAARKFNYYKNGNAPQPSDVYSRSSFDENCKMIYPRAYNQMLGSEQDAPVSFASDVFSYEFGDYINEYNRYVQSKGATLLYGFVPINLSGIKSGTTSADISSFYRDVDEYLDCGFLGNPENYFFETEWFYDSNFHMNTPGMTVYTRQLVCDLKAFIGDSSPVSIVLPQKPVAPDDGITGEDGVDADMFVYEEVFGGYSITGLSEEGKSRTELVIPDFYNGKKVKSFSEKTFAGNTLITSITLGRYITSVADYSFSGCTNLKRIYVNRENSPADCAVYFNFLYGAADCRIYVPSEKYGDYATSYWWSRYASLLVAYA